MNESILTSVKKVLGISEEYEHFDPDIVMHINASLGTLTQLGVGPSDGFMIQDKTKEWDAFIGKGTLLNIAKSYVYLKVRMLFDPPSSSAALDSTDRMIKEMEWRINTMVETSQEGALSTEAL